MNAFWDFWQHLPLKMNPVMLEIGLFQVRYYGLMYVFAFIISFYLVLFRIKKENRFNVSKEQMANLSTCLIAGVLVGGRLGYVLFITYPIIPCIRWKYFFSLNLQTRLPLQVFQACLITEGLSGLSLQQCSISGKQVLIIGK